VGRVELIGITPGTVGQYIVGLGGSASKRNLHLSALRGFFDRLVQRLDFILNPASSVSGVKEDVIEGKTPEITLEQTRKLVASIKITYKVKSGEVVNVVGLWDWAILATTRFTASRAGARAKLRLQDFRHGRRAVRAAVPGEGRQVTGNPGAARIAAGHPGLSGGGGHRRG